MQKVKTAVVGCGMISSIYIRNLSRLFYITDVTALCDRNREAAEAKAKEFGIPRVLSLDEVAADKEIELVVNLTAPVAHYDVIKQMLLAGKHVYTEKMFTVELAQAEELAALAEEKGLYLGVAPDTVLGAGVQTAKRLLELGMIGEVTSVQARINRNQSLNSEIFRFLRSPGGALPYDVGIYYVAALLALLGPVKAVRAFGAPAPEHRAENLFANEPEDSWQVPGSNLLAAALEFESGALGSVLFDGNTVGAQKHELIIYGTRGILELGDPNEFGGFVRLTLPESGTAEMPFTHGYDGKNRLGDPAWYDGYGNRGVGVAEMAWAIRGGRSNNRCSKEYGLHCMEVLLGMDAAAATGETVRPRSRFHMEGLTPGHYSTAGNGMGRGDAERSLID